MWSFWQRRLPAVGGLALIFLIFLASHGLVVALAVSLLLLATYLLRNLWQLGQLDLWLKAPDRPPPSGVGEWGDVFYLLGRQQRLALEGHDMVDANLEEMLQATRSLPDGIIVLGPRDRIAWLNDAASRYFGLSSTRDIDQFIHYLIRNSRFVEWLTLDDHSQVLKMRAPVGPEATLSLKLVRISPEQRMLIAHDITELERVDAMRRDFVANVSHELRTPVTVISGFLETFEDMDSLDPAVLRQPIHLMREQSDRIRNLLDDLLLLARMEGEQDIKNETIDVPALITTLANEARSISQGQHEIRVDMVSQAKIIGNQKELHSAFGNLVSNAIRYTPAGGQILLRWSINENGGGEFAVADTGEGIPPQHIPRLTERFYRVDRGRSRATGGTGLGLAIVKHILQRHQGRLKIESLVGKGSTFSVILPSDRIIPAAEPTPEASDAAKAPPTTAS